MAAGWLSIPAMGIRDATSAAGLRRLRPSAAAKSGPAMTCRVMSSGTMVAGVALANTVAAASDLFDARGSIYSDRQRLWSAKEIGYARLTPMKEYGETWKEHRRMMARTMGSKRVVEEGFEGTQVGEVRRLLGRLAENGGGGFEENLQRCVYASSSSAPSFLSRSRRVKCR